MKRIGYAIRLEQKEYKNEYYQYLMPGPGYTRLAFGDKKTPCGSSGWKSISEAEQAWESYYKKGKNLGVTDQKKTHNIYIVQITVEEEKIAMI